MRRAEFGAGGRLPGAAEAPTASLLTFGLEDRIQCGETGRVRGGLCVRVAFASRC